MHVLSAGKVQPHSANAVEGSSALVKYLLVPLAATVLMALSAHISVALPLTPVPTTMQTFAVMLIGIVLGPVAGGITMVLYLAEGAAGVPVFSPHGLGGVAQLFGPTAGYLLSYPFAAFLVGAVCNKLRSFLPVMLSVLVAAMLAEMLIFALGVAWLASIPLHLSASNAFRVGVLPFLPAEAIKLAFLTLLVTGLERVKASR